MSLIIPNAKQSTDGFKFLSLDQSEPDSLDFEILGDSGNGVLEGCEVTRGRSSFGLTISSGRVIVKGVHYDVGTANVEVASAVSTNSDKQYVLIVVEIDTGGNAVVKAIADPSNVGTNPTFPASVNIQEPGFIHLDHHVVLASVLLVGSVTPGDTNIVDKRVMRNTTNVSVVKDGAPGPSEDKAAPGQLYFDSSAQRGDESGLYVKTRTGSGSEDSPAWKELAVAKQVELPIGAVFAWPSANALSDSDRFLPASGQTVSEASFPALALAYGETGSFNLPDLNDGYVLKGTKSGTVGSVVGSDTVDITNSNLPPHTHGVKAHSHDMKHTHDVGHNHGAKHSHSVTKHYHKFSQSLSDTHSHDVGTHYHPMEHAHTASMNTAGAHAHWIDTSHTGVAQFWGYQTTNSLDTPSDHVTGKQSLHRSASYGTAGSAIPTRSYTYTPDTGHKHPLSIAKHTGKTDQPVDSNGGSKTNTGNKKIDFEVSGTTGSPVDDRGNEPAPSTGEALTKTDDHTGDTGASSAASTGSVSVNTDVNTTDSNSLSIVPKARLVVWYVRVS